MYRLGSSIPKERWFYCVDGTIITSIENLLERLQKLHLEQNKKIYEYHTQDHGNDFAKWIQNVYTEQELSQLVEQTNTVEELKETLKKFLQTCKEEGRIRNDENSLWLYYGIELNTLKDFIEELKKFGPDYHINTFNFHIKNNNNDFSNWLSACLNQKELAEKIRYCKTPQEILNIIEQKQNINQPEQPEEQNNSEQKEEEDLFEEQNPIIQNTDSLTYVESSEKMLDDMKDMKKRSHKKIDFFKQKEVAEEEYKKLKDMVSEGRKTGNDMFIPEVKLRNVKPKIKYLEASGNEQDYKNLMNYLKEIEQEIEEAKLYEEPNLKKEIETLAKQENNNQNQQITNQIDQE